MIDERDIYDQVYRTDLESIVLLDLLALHRAGAREKARQLARQLSDGDFISHYNKSFFRAITKWLSINNIEMITLDHILVLSCDNLDDTQTVGLWRHALQNMLHTGNMESYLMEVEEQRDIEDFKDWLQWIHIDMEALHVRMLKATTSKRHRIFQAMATIDRELNSDIKREPTIKAIQGL
ncbi:MAG: hypothetical protein PHV74_13875 [Dehalococcoidia bacterium]|nr:hypothetical protein [Dehalococcoidia bacterium]